MVIDGSDLVHIPEYRGDNQGVGPAKVRAEMLSVDGDYLIGVEAWRISLANMMSSSRVAE